MQLCMYHLVFILAVLIALIEARVVKIHQIGIFKQDISHEAIILGLHLVSKIPSEPSEGRWRVFEHWTVLCRDNSLASGSKTIFKTKHPALVAVRVSIIQSRNLLTENQEDGALLYQVSCDVMCTG
ncbi:hypothetical protein DL98DRAFT_200612 [Cadophora sp. DSE1049]|nr:hypothetical protein DL98DRAFT_200612 [Cadophora sp. DSE1049]